MGCEQVLLFWFPRPIGILGGGPSRDGAAWKRVHVEKFVLGGQIFVGGRECPFVVEVVNVVHLVEVVEMVMEVVAAVEQ